MRSRRLICGAAAVAALWTGIAGMRVHGQDHYAGREAWQRVPDIFKAMEVRDGSVVADLGAGGGFFTTRLSKAVGPNGRVFAVDINPAAITRLNAIVLAEKLPNVSVVPATPDDPQLPANGVDAILIVNAYHEMTEYQRLLPKLLAALKPGGRLAIVDNRPPRPDDVSGQQPRRPYLAIKTAAAQLEAAGFRVTLRDEAFTRQTSASGTERIEWLLIGRKGS